ncbi:MAG: YncE family protein [Sphingobacteriaceae bacterium]|nr:MAG: YncE family protein [Sphingobacteriaceae bacterium]
MKQFKINYLFAVLLLVTILTSCRKDKVEPDKGTPNANIYVLNQGGIGKNNSTLTYYDYATQSLIADQYFTANNNKLGDTGNDAVISGSKMYIAVNYSNIVTVVNAKGAKFIKQITLNQPRSVVAYQGNIFVSSYTNTVSVIDTSTLTITKTINVGRAPEQMVVSNGKLYVANSGGLDYPNFDKTVSVIDLTTLTETKKITVIDNPVTITADGNGNVYVLSLGNYGNVVGGMTVINNATDVVKSTSNPSLYYNVPMAIAGDNLYYPTGDKKIAVFNTKSQTVTSTNFITDGTTISEPYAITTDSRTGEVFIADAKDYSSNGTVYVFDKNGKKEYSITTGINPGKIVLIDK